MKKGIIVLLITVLVAGFAFAGTLTGNAGIEFVVDLDGETWGFDNYKSTKYGFTFEFDTTKVTVGEHQTDVWAELEATGSAKFVVKNGAVDGANPAISAKISKANIHVGDVTFGILNAGTTANYAASYYVNSTTKKPINNVVGGYDAGDGFTVEYDGYTGGLAAAGNFSGNYTIFAHAASKAFKFADDQVSAQAAAFVKISDAGNMFGGSVKAGYAADKLTADFAADLALIGDKFAPEIAASVKYDFVSAYLYVAPYPAGATELKVDAKVAANYTVEADDVTVALEGSVDGRDLTHDATTRSLTIKAKETCTIDAIEIEANEAYSVFAKTLNTDITATYAADAFEAYVGFGLNFQFNGGDAVTGLPIWAGITSTTIVENAEIGLVYGGLDVIAKTNGAITAYAIIEF